VFEHLFVEKSYEEFDRPEFAITPNKICALPFALMCPGELKLVGTAWHSAQAILLEVIFTLYKCEECAPTPGLFVSLLPLTEFGGAMMLGFLKSP
jgi:hypothetical protein